MDKSQLFSLEGKVALVTGARKGLGFGLAEGLAEAGADIVGVGPLPMPALEAAVASAGHREVEIGRASCRERV